MGLLDRIDSGDRDLLQKVDAALADGIRKSGVWLACRPGCNECCMGPFAITELDARRLRLGLAELEARDPTRAARIRERARLAVALPSEDEPCPVLDPETGLCELYAARPITCRTFGPPVRCGSDAVGVCELCFQGASESEVAACEVEVDPDGLESALLQELETAIGASGETLVAVALASPLVRA
jgi:Fe-S-cluster containining protein